jgi:5,10-methylene-tetrahydrofolate dehydrogenase/methenyl tetrahydrofolate cyclohydrolase
MKKDVVVGIGEIGKPILKLLSKRNITVGFDSNPDLMVERKFERYKNLQT